MSVRSHEARSLSYRDDLESIGYLIIYFLRGKLPWQGLAVKDRQKKVKAVGQQKKTMPVEELCQDCPPEMQDYLKYVRSIQFYAEPKYERLRQFFVNILAQNKWSDDGVFDWVGNVYDFSKAKKSESVVGKAAGSAGIAPVVTAAVDGKAKQLGRRQLGAAAAKEEPQEPKKEKKQKEKRERKVKKPPTPSSEPEPEPVVEEPKKPPFLPPISTIIIPTTKALAPPGSDPTVDPIIAFTGNMLSWEARKQSRLSSVRGMVHGSLLWKQVHFQLSDFNGRKCNLWETRSSFFKFFIALNFLSSYFLHDGKGISLDNGLFKKRTQWAVTSGHTAKYLTAFGYKVYVFEIYLTFQNEVFASYGSIASVKAAIKALYRSPDIAQKTFEIRFWELPDKMIENFSIKQVNLTKLRIHFQEFETDQKRKRYGQTLSYLWSCDLAWPLTARPFWTHHCVD